MKNIFNVDIDTKTLTPIIRELIREQLTQRENEEKQRIKQEELLTRGRKEKPLTDSEIRELRNLLRENKMEKIKNRPFPRVVSKEEWKY